MVDSVRLIQLLVHVFGWASRLVMCFDYVKRVLMLLAVAAWRPWRRRISGLTACRRWGRGRRTVSRPPVVSWTALSGPPAGRRKSRASHASEGAFSPMEAILSCTLIGPWSRPERSRAARTSRAWERTASGRRAGLERGRRDRGSSTAAGPSRRARRRRT